MRDCLRFLGFELKTGVDIWDVREEEETDDDDEEETVDIDEDGIEEQLYFLLRLFRTINPKLAVQLNRWF